VVDFFNRDFELFVSPRSFENGSWKHNMHVGGRHAAYAPSRASSLEQGKLSAPPRTARVVGVVLWGCGIRWSICF